MDHFGATADTSKVKAVFALFDEVLHLTSLAVKLDESLCRRVHVGNYKGIQVEQLLLRFFHLTDNASFIRPRSCLVKKVSIDDCRIDFVVFGDLIELLG